MKTVAEISGGASHLREAPPRDLTTIGGNLDCESPRGNIVRDRFKSENEGIERPVPDDYRPAWASEIEARILALEIKAGIK